MSKSEPDHGQEYVEAATRRFRKSLKALVAEHGRRGVKIRDMLGDPDDFATRALQATAPVPSPWDELIGPFTRSKGVQARLGITRQAVAAKASRRRLLRVVTSDGVHLYPLWQFDGNHILTGLPEVLALFPEDTVDGWTLAGWLRTPEPELGGSSPMDVIKGGEPSRVLAVARMAARRLAA